MSEQFAKRRVTRRVPVDAPATRRTIGPHAVRPTSLRNMSHRVLSLWRIKNLCVLCVGRAIFFLLRIVPLSFTTVPSSTKSIKSTSFFGGRDQQLPNQKRWDAKNGSSVGTCTRCVYALCTFGRRLACSVGAYKQNFCMGVPSDVY